MNFKTIPILDFKPSRLISIGLPILIFSLLFSALTNAQSRIYSDNISAVSNSSHITDANHAIDADLNTSARVRAHGGILLGIAGYNEYMELEFPTTLPANTTSFVKMETEDNLLDVLLGGSLGGVLSDLLGIILIGNQEFTVQAKNNNTVVLEGNSQVISDFTGARLKVVKDVNNDMYLMITPDVAYNRIRVTNRIGSLLGLGNTKDLWISGAYYYDSPSICGTSAYTYYDGSGISLDLLQLGQAGVTNPHHALDNDTTTYSDLSLGVLAVSASIQQTIVFEQTVNSNQSVNISLKVDPSLLALGVANNIEIIGANGGTIVDVIPLNSLLNLDLLTLLQGNQIAHIPYSPSQTIDRVTIRYNSLLNVQLTQSLDLYAVNIAPSFPSLDVAASDTLVCHGDVANLLATSNDPTHEFRWYDSIVSGNLLEVVNHGDYFNSPSIIDTVDFYVASAINGCVNESARLKVTVYPIPLPEIVMLSDTIYETDTLILEVTPSYTQGEWHISDLSMVVFDDEHIIAYLPGTLDVFFTDTVNSCHSSTSSIEILPLSEAPLPVELIYFEAKINKNDVKLNWSTASENNSKHFIIEKSNDDGYNWESIGYQMASGNSNITKSYSMSDRCENNRVYYYRLKQVDYNHTEQIYGPISVNCKSKEKEVKLFPNPSNNMFNISFDFQDQQKSAKGLIIIHSENGDVVKNKEIDINKGINNIEIQHQLSSGNYHIRLIIDNKVYTNLKFVVVK